MTMMTRIGDLWMLKMLEVMMMMLHHHYLQHPPDDVDVSPPSDDDYEIDDSPIGMPFSA